MDSRTERQDARAAGVPGSRFRPARPPAPGSAAPWYRDKWPWLLMAGPACSIVGGIVMLTLAIASNDGLVTDDYYREGRAINQTLTRERVAADADLRAHVLFAGDYGRVRVTFVDPRPSPSAVRLHLLHPTRAGLDRVALLQPSSAGVFEADIERPVAGRWRVLLEDEARTWRMSAQMSVPRDGVVMLAGR
jgi:uncharacterized protein